MAGDRGTRVGQAQRMSTECRVDPYLRGGQSLGLREERDKCHIRGRGSIHRDDLLSL